MFSSLSAKLSIVCLAGLATPLLGAMPSAAPSPGWDLAFSQGVAALNAGTYREAIARLDSALDLARHFPPNDLRLIKSLYALALAHQIHGEPDAADSLYLEARTNIDEAGDPARPLLGYVLQGIGQLRFDQGQWKEAENLLRQSIAECSSNSGPNHPSTLAAERHLAEVLAARGSVAEAQRLFESVILTVRENPSSDPELLASTLTNLAAVDIHNDRLDLAEPLLKESLDLVSQRSASSPVLADTLLGIGELYRLQRNPARAEPLLKKALNIYETANDPHQAGALNELGLLALDERKFAIARNYLKASLHLYEKVIGSAHVLMARGKAALARAALGEGDIPQARSLIREALITEQHIVGDRNSDYARLLMIAGKVEETARQKTQADRFYREALAVYRDNVRAGNPERTEAEQSYARFAKSLRSE